MQDFKAERSKPNPYREKILDEVCMEAFGSTHPTKEGVFFNHGTVVARMFAKGTQGRADLVRSLKTGAQGLLEQHGPTVLASQQLEVLRGVSKVPSSTRISPSRQRVTLKSVARGTTPGSSEFPPVPKLSRPTTRSLAPGRRWQAVATAESADDAHIARIREGKEEARRHEIAQAVAAAVPVSPPPMPPPSLFPGHSNSAKIE